MPLDQLFSTQEFRSLLFREGGKSRGSPLDFFKGLIRRYVFMAAAGSPVWQLARIGPRRPLAVLAGSFAASFLVVFELLPFTKPSGLLVTNYGE